MTIKEPQIFEGQVFHSRSFEATHGFTYPIFNLFFQTNQMFSLKNIFKKRSKLVFGLSDETFKSENEAQDFIFNHFKYKPETMILQNMPKILGYSFNPITFWYCFKEVEKSEILEAVLVEVNNTFNEKHYYWLYQNGQCLQNKWIQTKKEFHVSPFFPIDGFYNFRFSLKKESVSVDIHYFGSDQVLKLITGLRGTITPLSSKSLTQLFIKYGWMTAFVVFRIHYNALILFFKKVTFYKKPNRLKTEITHESTFNRG